MEVTDLDVDILLLEVFDLAVPTVVVVGLEVSGCRVGRCGRCVDSVLLRAVSSSMS